MTEETTPAVSPEDHQQVLMALRNSLINSAFQQYHSFTNFLKTLPVMQNTPEMQHAYLSLGTGILWIQDVLRSAQLIMPSRSAPEEKPVEDNNTQA